MKRFIALLIIVFIIAVAFFISLKYAHAEDIKIKTEALEDQTTFHLTKNELRFVTTFKATGDLKYFAIFSGECKFDKMKNCKEIRISFNQDGDYYIFYIFNYDTRSRKGFFYDQKTGKHIAKLLMEIAGRLNEKYNLSAIAVEKCREQKEKQRQLERKKQQREKEREERELIAIPKPEKILKNILNSNN